ncbi:aspartyl protease family protein 2-like [Chenopodium quinoa]|uniref:aspartyl protease family protein 2-like n=1 Tax=Chenopodium quinoa TaxID=63459 RepID=UPI000B7780BE|nr:aspartyl protease family protein 2-like [Chenopodium quinoa]
MEEGKPTSFSLFFLVIFLSLSLCSSLELQNLLLNPLPKPSSLLPNTEWDLTAQLQVNGELSGSVDTSFELSGSLDSTVALQLEHLDALEPHLSQDELFAVKLKRDEARVVSILARAQGVSHSSKRGSHKHRPGPHHGRNASQPRAPAGAAGSSGFSSSVTSGLAQGSGEYFTRLGVGSPPRYMYMVLDTGSDIVWLQCSPCKRCYDQTDQVFNPAQSGSFRPIPCRSKICQQLDQPGCAVRGNRCAYQVSYGDGSFTMGEFASETMTFRRTKVPNVALGCGHDNEGLFVGAAGLLGLGRGKLSFPSQTGNRFGNKFSYCLVDRSASSKPSSVVFGASAVSRNAVFTPLIPNPKLDTFYYVELLGFSVGGTRVPGITGELFKIDRTGNGGIILDSGTSVTRLTRPAYIALRDAFRAGASSLKTASGFSLFDTCFDLSGKTEVRVPTVVMHFNGADISLPANNYLIPVDTSGRFCFAFAGTMSGLSIIGNIQQQGIRVSFDVASRRVGFLPNACT